MKAMDEVQDFVSKVYKKRFETKLKQLLFLRNNGNKTSI
jgi:hypothetical protein